jgi:hypothetical protein
MSDGVQNALIVAWIVNCIMQTAAEEVLFMYAVARAGCIMTLSFDLYLLAYIN